ILPAQLDRDAPTPVARDHVARPGTRAADQVAGCGLDLDAVAVVGHDRGSGDVDSYEVALYEIRPRARGDEHPGRVVSGDEVPRSGQRPSDRDVRGREHLHSVASIGQTRRPADVGTDEVPQDLVADR